MPRDKCLVALEWHSRLSPMWSFQYPERTWASTQEWFLQLPNALHWSSRWQSHYLLKQIPVQITERFSFLSWQATRACLLTPGIYWRFNTREWLIKASGRTALPSGTTGWNNRFTQNGLCSFILAWRWESGKSVKWSWGRGETEERCASCSRGIAT